MDGVFLVIVIALLVVIATIQIFLLVRKVPVDLTPLQQALRSVEQSDERTERSVREEIAKNREEAAKALRQSREELAGALKGVGDTLYGQVGLLTQTTDKKLDMLREAVEQRLQAIQADNAKQLDQMRATVDEKLQGTLEKRLGESFKQVSERLEQVSKGLGEMQSLAAGVGDLKKVLTNVKTRGTWGEVQLGAMLEQVLTPDQYAANVAVKEGGERVEFAIKLPGRGEDEKEMVWLPIDAKFPVEDYQRLMDAEEKADAESAEGAAKQLEARIRQCAGDICSKYLNPPKTTDFGILFLPTEGLFAEVIRRTGLVEFVQRECRVVIAGPTTLWALLNSLQMGFRTLAIQQRSSEVWNLLSAVKTEWTKYGDVLTKVQKKIHEASETIEQAQTRTRAIGRKLKDVQELPAAEAKTALMLENGGGRSDGETGEMKESGPDHCGNGN
jgi:DNA recombination protein RmuC